MASIAETIQQHQFEDPRQKVLINLVYSAGWAKSGTSAALKPYGLTWQQFNLLRILRGQQGKPVTMRAISERMLDAQSNASRLVDKLELKGFVTRTTCDQDRRQVRIGLTTQGQDILAEASASTKAYYSSLGSDLSDEEMETLSELLDRFRDPRKS